MTSNSEKSLPEPFLRRCIFYHIPFPDPDQLMEIALRKISGLSDVPKQKVKASIEHFGTIREKVKKKMPCYFNGNFLIIQFWNLFEVRDLDFFNFFF